MILKEKVGRENNAISVFSNYELDQKKSFCNEQFIMNWNFHWKPLFLYTRAKTTPLRVIPSRFFWSFQTLAKNR